MQTSLHIGHLRLASQRISSATFATPGEVVSWLGAVQAQDYLSALWAVGLRMRQATEAAIERAIAQRTIVRTWPMRGTIHFVAPDDIRWMLDLLAQRVIARSAGRNRQLELDDATFARSRELIVSALQGETCLPRNAVYGILDAAGIATAGARGLHIVQRLALEGLICFGPREGKQPTFVLLDEWLPPTRPLPRDAALAELARRYFTSHGPATPHDFAWWSGLTLTEARAGIHMAQPHLAQEVIQGQTYWLPASMPAAPGDSPGAYMLPAFDEYTVAYKDRSAVLKPGYAQRVLSTNGILYPTIVVDGYIVGLWKRTLKKNTVIVSATPFEPLDAAAAAAVAEAARRYGAFLGAAVVLG